MFSLWTNRLVFCLSHLAFMEQLNSVKAPSLNHMKPFSQQIPSNNFVKPSTGLGQLWSNCPADKTTCSHVVKRLLFDLMHKKMFVQKQRFVFKSLHSPAIVALFLGEK